VKASLLARAHRHTWTHKDTRRHRVQRGEIKRTEMRPRAVASAARSLDLAPPAVSWSESPSSAQLNAVINHSTAQNHHDAGANTRAGAAA